jgi:replicative DNA helicase
MNTRTYKIKDIEKPARKIEGRVPPHSEDAEISVLSALMLDRKAIPKAIEIITAECFYNEKHKIIYETIINMFEKAVSVDLVTLNDELEKKGVLEMIGGSYYLSRINSVLPSSANIEHHARIVLEKYLKRSLIEISGQIMENAFDDTTDAFEEIDRAESEVFSLAEKRLKKSYTGMKELAHEAYQMISRLSERNSGSLTGVPSGIKKLDDKLGGFQNSDLIIIAARPSMGKTALALSMARNMAVEYKIPVAFFSLEMASIQLVVRLLSAEAAINQQNIRTGKISDSEHPRIIKALGKLSHAPLMIDDSAMLTVMEIRAKCRRLKAEHNIKAIFVDYLQYVHAPKSESREREISIISQTLKQIAKELEIPVIALAQLNRSVDSRHDKRPLLSDLRESGSIEQDADVVLFVNRPEVYGQMQFDDETKESTENKAELIIGKQRNGPIGTVRVGFQKDFARFENLVYNDMPPEQEHINDREDQRLEPEFENDDAPF